MTRNTMFWIFRLMVSLTCVGTVVSRSGLSTEQRIYEQLSVNYSRLMRPVSSSGEVVTVNMTLHYYQLLDLSPLKMYGDSVNQLLSVNYSRLMLPVSSSGEAVTVNMTLHYYQLLHLDEKREVIESVLWIEQEWYDSFFRWDPAKHDDVQLLVLPSDVLWVPDLYVLNLVGDADNIVTPFLGSMETLIVWSSGRVVRISPFRLTTSCAVSLLSFPFDHQTCEFSLGSWAYNIHQLRFQLSREPVLAPGHTSADWVLSGLTGKEWYYPYDNPPTNYSLMVFSLSLSRRPLYHITYLVVPSLMLNMIVSFSFFLPPEAGERVSLGLTSFLAYSVFIMVMADKIPESTTTMPLISALFLISMTLTMVTILWSVFAIRIHFRSSGYGPPPSWLLSLARMIESSWCSTLTRKREAYPHMYSGETNAMIATRGPNTSTAQAQGGVPKTTSGDPMKRTSSRDMMKSSRSCVRISQQNSLDTDNETLSLQEKRESEESWKMIMCAADRVMFCLFMITTFAGLLLMFIAKAQ